MMWSEVYRPMRVQQMIGNEGARLAVVKWLSGWVDGSRPLLLIGPPGIGKTTLVHTLSQQFNYDLIELNASDNRNKIGLQNRIMPIFHNAGLFGRKMMLFLDEVDGISGREDTGGIDSLITIMKEPTIPVIMAANTKNIKIKDLAKICKVIELNSIPPRLLMIFLDHILKEENKKLSPDEKVSVVNNSKGDVRSMLNNAQSKCAGYTSTHSKRFEIDIAEAINGYFSMSEVEEAKNFLSQADAAYLDSRFGMSAEERRKDMINALFSSIVSSPIDLNGLADALDVLSKIDVIVGRIGQNRYWRLMKYLDVMIAYGLFSSTRQKGIKYNQYSVIWPLMNPISVRAQYMKNLLSALSKQTHVTKSIFGSIYFPYLLQLLVDKKIDLREFSNISNLDEKSGEALTKEMDLIMGKRNE
ncbi:MAG TPA: AAA family ATPase [Nitrososphaeraceae archaeon]|nr:AAA family ATPase [Nitrososphaeraceae archaeon]